MRFRNAHRNEQYLYKNTSAFSGKPLISIYSKDKPCQVYSPEEWFSDKWDALEYGKDYDFSKTFFQQFNELCLETPKLGLVAVQNENSPYVTSTAYSRNCYLINCSENCEDSYYSKLLQKCKDIVDSSYIYDSELIYQGFNLRKCYNCKFVYNSENSSDCAFSDNLNGCKDCFLSTNLSHKEYYFLNEQLTKEEYSKKIKEFEGYEGQQRALELLKDLQKKKIYKYANIVNSERCSGDFIRNSKNCTDSYDLVDSEDCMYTQVGVKAKSIVDCSNMYEGPELSYQTLGTMETYNVNFSFFIFNSNDVWYSEHCHGSKNLFGCSGIRNKQYCILNKQYSKEEYEELVAKIIKKMMQDDEWGQIIPPKNSFYNYNETVANDYAPLTKDEALSKDFEWKDLEEQDFSNVTNKIQAKDLPDTISEVNDEIQHWVIECAESKRPFKIQEGELKFYRQMNLPIPHLHPDIRHSNRMKLRNARILNSRNCNQCNKDIKTTFTTSRSEAIYCEECYIKEIY